MLNEILGDLSAALDCYEKYLKISKQNSNKRSVAQAYGCLGGVHAGLCNWPMAVMYHQQHIAMAARLGNARMVAMANEMLGDTYMLREEFDKAVQLYETVISACTHNESRLESVTFKLEFLNLWGVGGGGGDVADEETDAIMGSSFPPFSSFTSSPFFFPPFFFFFLFISKPFA